MKELRINKQILKSMCITIIKNIAILAFVLTCFILLGVITNMAMWDVINEYMIAN